jgi:hypothetical protein
LGGGGGSSHAEWKVGMGFTNSKCKRRKPFFYLHLYNNSKDGRAIWKRITAQSLLFYLFSKQKFVRIKITQSKKEI